MSRPIVSKQALAHVTLPSVQEAYKSTLRHDEVSNKIVTSTVLPSNLKDARTSKRDRTFDFMNSLHKNSVRKYVAVARRLYYRYVMSEQLGPVRGRYVCLYPGKQATAVYYDFVIQFFWPLRGCFQDTVGQYYAFCQETNEFHLVEPGKAWTESFAKQLANRVVFI